MTHADSRTPSALSLSDLNTTVNHEPRILDTRLGEVLGLSRPWDIRKLIERNRAELERYGVISATVALNAGRGRPGKQYWLTEGQALCLSALSDAPNAPDARQMLIEVYMAYRRGQTVPATKTIPVRAHSRRTPAPALAPSQDGVIVAVIEGRQVVIDTAIPWVGPGDLVAVFDPLTDAMALYRQPMPDGEYWPEPLRRSRRTMVPTSPTIRGVSREWTEAIVLGRVVALQLIDPARPAMTEE